MALESERQGGAAGSLLGALRDRVGSARDSILRGGEEVLQRSRSAVRGIAEKTGLNEFTLPEPFARWSRKLSKGGVWNEALVAWFNRQPLVKFISASLVRRILASNLIGFVIMFGGILYLSLDSSWIINAKREALRTQGKIIAAAIAGKAMVRNGEIRVDPDRLPAAKESLIPFRDDGFASLQLSIQPERVAPIFRRLTEPTGTRARIYDRNGDLVVDSSDLLASGDIIARGKAERTAPTHTKNFWTRLQHLLIGKEVQVYREIGNANGQYYPEVRRALKGEDAAMLLLNEKSEQIVSVAIPITRLKKVIGVLLLSTRPGDIDNVLAESRSFLWPLALIALIASIATALFLNRTVVGPMKRLSETAEHVSHDITARTNLPDYSDRKDEVGQMAQAFAQMTRSLYQRIEASEKFAADVAHELKNPLTAASSMAQALEYARTEEDREQVVSQIQHELKRLNRLISDVASASMLNAQLQLEVPEPVAVNAVLADVVGIFEDKSAGDGATTRIDFKVEGPPEVYCVSGNAGRLGQVFTNLIDNALSFSPDDGTVNVRARVDGDRVVIAIEDEGPGIDDENLETIFTRFYTYRPDEYSSRGTNSGLGLSISKEIIESHKGRIWAERRFAPGTAVDGKERTGSRFVVELPRRLQTAPPRSRTA